MHLRHTADRPCLTGQGGFTLLEVIIVLALIGLLTGLVAGGSVALLREKPVTGEEVLRSIISKVRRDAVIHFRDIRLSYDEKNKVFHESWADGEKQLAVDVKGELKLEFLSTAKGSSMLLGGDVVETETIPFVTFYSDGCCSPFRVQLRTGGPARQVSIDPWTCAEIIEKKQN
jgi:general secretion pathway protein H